MNVRGVSEGIYLPCIWLNPTTQKAEVGTYSYTALMEKFQKQVEQVQGKPPELGNQTLSEAEIKRLRKSMIRKTCHKRSMTNSSDTWRKKAS